MSLKKLDKLVDLEKFDNNFDNKFQNIEAEIAVIGCLLWDNRNYDKIADLLERLDKEIQKPKDSVHKIVLKITIDNINKLLK